MLEPQKTNASVTMKTGSGFDSVLWVADTFLMSVRNHGRVYVVAAVEFLGATFRPMQVRKNQMLA